MDDIPRQKEELHQYYKDIIAHKGWLDEEEAIHHKDQDMVVPIKAVPIARLDKKSVLIGNIGDKDKFNTYLYTPSELLDINSGESY